MPLGLAPELTVEPPVAAPVSPGVPLIPTTTPDPARPVEALLPEAAVPAELPDITELPVVSEEFPEPPPGVPDMPIGTVLAS